MSEVITTLFGESVSVATGGDSGAPAKVPFSAADRDMRAFRMTDMLFIADKKKLWIEVRTLLRDGYAPDALFPVMWWGIKSALHTYEGIGDVKPFVRGKLKPLLQKVSKRQLYDIALSFFEMVIYTRSQPGVTAEFAFEKWILELPI